MSDFDKEAERQRLREKYEKDADRRQETQRMSELLLQGATMTNKHCDDCGTPVFRYQGTEFCPNCQQTQADAAAERADAAAAEAADGRADANGANGRAAAEGTADGESAAAERATEADSGDATAASPGSAESTAAESASPQSASRVGTGHRDDGPTATRAPAATAESETAAETPERGASGASVQAARESLLEAITRHARRATATDEPRRAKQHLEAAREAAEAVGALDR